MGLFSKIMDVFYDTEEEEEVIEEPKREERPKPKIEEVHFEKKPLETKTESIESERDLFKPETKTFKFPILEEDEKPKVRTRSTINYEEERPIKRDTRFDFLDRKPEKKEVKQEHVFKPSPVISPVYGVLDKNYSKEEIVERKEVINSRSENKELNYDTVRRKAYGTLEDEIEDTLININDTKEKEIKDIDEKLEEVDKNNKSIEDLLSEIEINKNMSIGEIEEKLKDEYETAEIKFEKEEDDEEFIKKELDKTQNFDKTLEHDLFNLIDSMYEDKEEE